MASNVPPELSHLESLSHSEIEVRLQKLRSRNPAELTDEELEEAVSLHTIARRKTAGPPAPRKPKGPAAPMSLDDLEKLGI